MKDSIYNYTQDDLKKLMQQHGFPRYAAQQVMQWVYQKRVEGPEAMTNLSKALRSFLKERFAFHLPIAHTDTRVSSDGTTKFLLTLEEGMTIESVLMFERERVTLCISTQVGCACGCAFCASAKKGLVRDLSVAEIVGQYFFADRYVHETVSGRQAVTNVVFMGMGEPLNNFPTLVKSIALFADGCGIGLGKRRMCVSTCGIVPGIQELAKLNTGVKLSVSLNAVTDEQRRRIMPVNKEYPLKELLSASRAFAKASRFPITFEYIMFSGFNMSRQDAQSLSKILKTMKAKVNFIPYNPIGKDLCAFAEPSEQEVKTFVSYMDKNVFSSIRKSKGRDILAACGNLSFLLTHR